MKSVSNLKWDLAPLLPEELTKNKAALRDILEIFKTEMEIPSSSELNHEASKQILILIHALTINSLISM